MARTMQFGLPLVAPAQAQKHVTVNEALARLDAVAQLRVVSSILPTPPSPVLDGACFLVPEGAEGEWAGAAGRIAVGANGGWAILEPRAGWLAWDEGAGVRRLYDGAAWIEDAVAVSRHGAATITQILEFDHEIIAGPTNATSVAIPSQAQVIGVTGRVISPLGGTLSGWRVGVAGSDDRYATGLGTGLNAHLSGLSGSPLTYYAPTPLLLSAEGGSFAEGSVRLAVHLTRISPSRGI
jgi:hypothetical protein